MPKRKPLLLVLACFALVLLAWVSVLAFRPFSPRHHIDRRGVRALYKGMTEAEVVQVLGVPAGDYAPGRAFCADHHTVTLLDDIDEPLSWKEWVGDEVRVRIGFDQDGKAYSISHNGAMPGQDILSRLLRLLHLKR